MEECFGKPNHAALVVGYGTEEVKGLEFWILRNSWGTEWGEDGYMRVAIQVGDGVCGI